MNALSFYDRSKAGWTSDEANAVAREYGTEMLSILDIADLHRRTPGSIAYKLKSMGVISDPNAARGYTAYKSGNLYKEIISSSKTTEPSKFAQKQPNEIVLRIASNDEILAEVKSLKSELSELKSDFKALQSCLMSLVDRFSKKPERKSTVHARRRKMKRPCKLIYKRCRAKLETPSNRIESIFGDEDLEKFFET